MCSWCGVRSVPASPDLSRWVMCSGGRYQICRWLRRSSSFLLPSVTEIMSESFVGAVDGSGSVGFAAVDNGASALGP